MPYRTRPGNHHEGATRRCGFVAIYIIITMVGLMALVSLAVDLGRAQCAKTELQRAADAAARYGASGLGDNSAIDKAITAAKENLVDGVPLVLDNTQPGTPKDVEVGNWDATQTPRFSATRLPVNAVRVTARRVSARNTAVPLIFGRIIGRSSCDIVATCIAQKSGGAPNFIGLGYITAKNNTSIGYDPSLGPPGGNNALGGASIASNGSIAFSKPASINGSVLLGPDGTYNGTSPTPTMLAEDLSYPPTESPPSIASGSLVVNGNPQHVQGGGTLVYSSIVLSNNSTLIFDNPTTVYVTGDITFSQSGVIAPASGRPSDLKIRMIGSPKSVVGGSSANNVDITGQIYAPSTDFVAKNNGILHGTALFRSMSATNQLSLYYDVTSPSVVAGVGSTATFSSAVTVVQ